MNQITTTQNGNITSYVLMLMFIFGFGIFGCTTQSQPKSSVIRCYSDSEWDAPQLPKSAEKRLLEFLDSPEVVQINELAFTSGKYVYLAVNGLFAIKGDVVDVCLVLIRDIHEWSWDDARICVYEPYVEYTNENGVIKEAYIRDMFDLFDLPENAMLKALRNVKDLSVEDALQLGGITLYLGTRDTTQHSALMTNAPPQGVEGSGGSESFPKAKR